MSFGAPDMHKVSELRYHMVIACDSATTNAPKHSSSHLAFLGFV